MMHELAPSDVGAAARRSDRAGKRGHAAPPSSSHAAPCAPLPHAPTHMLPYAPTCSCTLLRRFDPLSNYSNERSLFLASLRSRVEARWQAWEARQLPAGAHTACLTAKGPAEVAEALHMRCVRAFLGLAVGRGPVCVVQAVSGERAYAFAGEGEGRLRSVPKHCLAAPRAVLDAVLVKQGSIRHRSWGRSCVLGEPPYLPPARFARDVDPPTSPALSFIRDDMGPLGYAHLLAAGSVDGLVEASRQSRVRGRARPCPPGGCTGA